MIILLIPKLSNIQTHNPKELCALTTVPRMNDEYEVLNSEDELDQDNRSIEENEEEEEETSAHLIKAVGFKYHTDMQEEIQDVSDKRAYLLGVGNFRNSIANKFSPVHLLLLADPILDPKAGVYNDKCHMLEC